MYALREDVYFTSISGAVEATETRMCDELLGRLLGQVSITPRHMGSANAKFPNAPMRQWLKFVYLENHVSDVSHRRANRDSLPRPQTLSTCVSASLGRAVGVDNLPSSPRPGLHKCIGKSFAGRHNITANRIGQVHMGIWRKGGEKHRRTEKHSDFRFAQHRDEVRPGSDLLLGQHNDGATGYPGAVHL